MIDRANLERLEEIKLVIQSLLVSTGNKEVTIHYLNRIYKEQTDEDIPYVDYGFTNLKEFLKTFSDILHLEYNKKEDLCVYGNDSEKCQHILDLVRKQKQSTPRGGSKYVNRNNPINPYVLLQALKYTKKNFYFYTKKQKCVKKADVLNHINKNFNVFSSHKLIDLSSQLNEVTHLLTHDDDIIYFKECRMEYVHDLIKETTKIRLQKLIQSYPDGIWCNDLPKEYLETYKLELEYIDIGFNSIVEFIKAMPNIFQIISPPYSSKFKVINSSISENNLDFEPLCPKFMYRIDDDIISKLNITSVNLSFEQDKIFISDDSINLSDSVDQMDVNSVMRSYRKKFKVIVTEVRSPSVFWVILYKNRNELKNLMLQLQDFYETLNLNKFAIPESILKTGLHVACKFINIWHRGIITKIGSKQFKVFFYDYGTELKCNKEEVFLLERRFTNFPAQAMLCGLNNVKPRRISDVKWSKEVCQKFSNKVLNKPFYASICSINEQNNSMILNLVDVHKTHIKEWFIKEKLAKEGDLISFKKNINFKNY